MKRSAFAMLIVFLLGVLVCTALTARAEDEKLPKSKKLIQVQKKIKAVKKEIASVEKGKHEDIKAQTAECDALGEKVDEAENEWKKVSKKLDEKTRKELLKLIKEDPNKRIGEYMDVPEGISKSDFYVCVGAAKKLVELQIRYEEMDEKLVGEMRELIEKLEKRLERPNREIEGLLAEYREAVLLDALSSCKDYKKRSAVFPVEEMTKHVPDLQKLYKNDFNWTEDDVWNALEETWETARPCIPKSERDKIRRKAEKERQEKEQLAKEKEARSRTASRKNAGKNSGRTGKKDDPFSSLVAGQRIVKKINGVEFAFHWCPPGMFNMSYENLHGNVTLTRGFWILETEVTQAMWVVIMGNNPCENKGPNLPVDNISWDECHDFCRKLSGRIGAPLALPTVAQWEYACQAGGSQGSPQETQVWCSENSGGTIQPVAQKQANAWGLYDMYGNVWEWCQDGQGNYPNDMMLDPVVPPAHMYVIRGGCVNNGLGSCRGARRWGTSNFRAKEVGFRVVQIPPGQKPITPQMAENQNQMSNGNQFGGNQSQFNGNQFGGNQFDGNQPNGNPSSNGNQFSGSNPQSNGNQASGSRRPLGMRQFGRNRQSTGEQTDSSQFSTDTGAPAAGGTSSRSGDSGRFSQNSGLNSRQNTDSAIEDDDDLDLDLDLDDEIEDEDVPNSPNSNRSRSNGNFNQQRQSTFPSPNAGSMNTTPAPAPQTMPLPAGVVAKRGTIKAGEAGLKRRPAPGSNERKGTLHYGDQAKVLGITVDGQWFYLEDGSYVNANPAVGTFTPE